ncbi:B-cell receptor CD22-like isoform X8 [Pygocentrus nattereri]|uniref:B-cell receptor CD22-like isoform X8 n=1 Tax=Pygocentrus nattereri TaxID=42514 RepID=UPI001890BD89|nr:B-cell receptor CD22-like isoform X8 [Pygocentrus nattereri]
MKKISSVDSGEYKCRSSNEHGEKFSEALTLNVLYPPKSISVSISPSGEIVEGSSVNLTCSSDANPPVEYNWFKGTSIVGKGETYTMKKISSVDSGEYKCRSSNKHGEKLSEALTLNVLYPPKSVSVSISPSGEIVEGSSVTLTCSSDANPPVEYNWIKGTSSVGKGETYTMKEISSVDSGQYTCRSSNEHGEKLSEAVTLNVLYPPKNISVSISPSGEIVEGSSVNLTCSSDANPPVEYYWFKGTSIVGKGETHTMKNISSVDSGEYKCRSSNKHGEKLSEALTLNVLYPPKNISVSISPSGEIMEGSSLNLTCSSDGNPPVQNYTWFKGASLVAEGETYTMKKISSVDSGQYKCKCSNEHGEKVSEALTLNVLYPPKNISVSVSPYGEIMEGRSVTLTCSSDANPPVEYNWIKGTSSVGKGETYTMKKISSVDRGEYKCRSSNKHGEKLSEALTLNVLYPPKNISVSINPSGEIVEGRSVTLTCSSDANPPVEYNWIKGTSSVGKGETYTMKNISSVDSGEYKCRSSNEHGEKFSEALTVNVLYPPKSVSVSISPSGEIVEGSSVNLTCSSDGNPPVEYNWFKGTSIVGKGETYTMKNISSVDSGQYKCRSSNEHGEKLSEALNLNVLYPPKNISVSISPSGEIMEGSSLNLTCSSDANPPVQNYTWFKGASLVAEGETYTMKNISSVDSGQYKCRSSNEHGEKVSEALTLNVLYPPKNISVSVSPYGEIMEGRSVTLTCSSDANPPVEYNWIKGTSSVGKGETYTMKNISSVDRGEYNCRSSNKHGEKLSEALTLNVLYPPKSVSVSISPSSETAEGSSVNLTCSSDANPPLQNYTWFKEGGSSPVGSGHSYMAPQSGIYYCEAQNEHGSQKSAAVTVTVKGGTGVLIKVICIVVGVVALWVALLCIVFCVRRNRQGSTATCKTQENLYSNLGTLQDPWATTSDDSDPSNEDDVQYASVVPLRVRNIRNAENSAMTASAFGTDEEVLYASIQHRCDKVVDTTEEDDVQYASVRFIHTGAANRRAVSTYDDVSVIYSTLK